MAGQVAGTREVAVTERTLRRRTLGGQTILESNKGKQEKDTPGVSY